jgi:hypothetical protein
MRAHQASSDNFNLLDFYAAPSRRREMVSKPQPPRHRVDDPMGTAATAGTTNLERATYWVINLVTETIDREPMRAAGRMNQQDAGTRMGGLEAWTPLPQHKRKSAHGR